MSVFSEAELAYLAEGGKLGRLATVDDVGQPHNVPVGWSYNAQFDTIDVGGRDFARTRKYRNVQANPLVCLVIDDVVPPWHPRCVQIRGHARVVPDATAQDGTSPRPVIRITPTKVVSWGLERSGEP